MNLKTILISAMLAGGMSAQAQPEPNRWHITGDGNITWNVDNRLPHTDHIEMSGKRISAIIRYGVNGSGAFTYTRSLVFPMLRTIPNDTHASLIRRMGFDIMSSINVNGRLLDGEKVLSVTLDGAINTLSEYALPWDGKLELRRALAPSVTLPAFVESYTLKNTGKRNLTVEIPSGNLTLKTSPDKSVGGSYAVTTKVTGGGTTLLKPNDEVTFGVYFTAYRKDEAMPLADISSELKQRKALVAELRKNLILETPDTTINTMFSFAKLRASESIYETKGGPMHGPGGEMFYAAIWANDQAEYINPFFPYLGYDYGNRSAINAYSHFARFMNPDYKPIPSSIIAEGTDIWNGAGDRGDAAMIAYGAARFALSSGSKEIAGQLWPLIEWCLTYCDRKLNADGVVTSDSDELEGRFPAGDANLCTSSLYYDALLSAAYLGRELRKPASQLKEYAQKAQALHTAINTYFNGPVEGFDTYRYYKGNDVLRSWICIPLTVGIFEKKEATIKALLSPRLWTPNGLLTQAGTETFWDRSTLYALRGLFYSGEADTGLGYLDYYSNRRLLGEHVPYAIEAYPERNQSHLSAESGLYCRVITEGLFGIRPTGLRSFTLKPALPAKWDRMAIRRVMAYGSCFDIAIERKGKKIAATITTSDGKKYSRQADPNQEIAFTLR